MEYDSNNVFAKIIRGEIPSKKIYEDDLVLAFFDAFPVAPTHILVIPKGRYIDYVDFFNKASKDEVAYYFTKVKEVATSMGLESFRICSNIGEQSGQTVFHFHTHILGGAKFGGLIGNAISKN